MDSLPLVVFPSFVFLGRSSLWVLSLFPHPPPPLFSFFPPPPRVVFCFFRSLVLFQSCSARQSKDPSNFLPNCICRFGFGLGLRIFQKNIHTHPFFPQMAFYLFIPPSGQNHKLRSLFGCGPLTPPPPPLFVLFLVIGYFFRICPPPNHPNRCCLWTSPPPPFSLYAWWWRFFPVGRGAEKKGGLLLGHFFDAPFLFSS